MEFALVVPILLLLMAGGTDLARAYFVGIQVADGARQAALFASEYGSTYTSGQLTTIAESNAGSGGFLGCPSTHIGVSFGTGTGETGSSTGSSKPYYQPVTVICNLPMLTPLIPSPVAIRATAEVLIVPSS